MDMKKELLIGLKSTPKYIPGWYRYDKEGSRLNDICLEKNQNYYFNRCELSVLETHISNMVTVNAENTALIDMGSGNCQKTRIFINEILRSKNKISFYPIDISKDALLETCKQLSEDYEERLDINPIDADYETGITKLNNCPHSKLILWFGSIQNLQPDDQIRKLQLLRSVMKERCCLIFSVDTTQNREDIMKAYDDFHGRQFLMNFIWRLIREERCTIDPDHFDLEVQLIRDDSPDKMSSVQALVRAKKTNSFIIPTLGVTVNMVEGEPLYLHDGPGLSHKYTSQQVQTLIERAGLQLVDKWVDNDGHVMFCKCKVL
ncbi:histidine N-alpha-methyltransferase-like [Ylistrum balloti]|uniref:histidine N-alpha-methyltransferase-like n=1 Tax=Ylistrum balloti TaxID=509963 RepID=UPI002905A143|nr:histidine N-alpha-methyltransferase-like [Ylistrum balloti]